MVSSQTWAIERDFIAWKDVTHDYEAMAAFLHSYNSFLILLQFSNKGYYTYDDDAYATLFYKRTCFAWMLESNIA